MPIPLLAIAWWLAGPAKLDNDTERWLKQVHLLMLPDEEAVFRGLEDAADRKEFERIFWARRDPDPSTAANELQGMVSRAWAAADARFPSPGRKGSESGCGQVLALLGEPLEVEGREMKTRFESLPAMREGARRPEVWTYRSRPGDAVELTGYYFAETIVPEPSAVVLLSLGVLFVACRRRRRCRSCGTGDALR